MTDLIAELNDLHRVTRGQMSYGGSLLCQSGTTLCVLATNLGYRKSPVLEMRPKTMIPARTELTGQQTATDALNIIATARTGSQRIKINSDGNIVLVDKPTDVIGKLIYAAKRFLYGEKDLSVALQAVFKKMESDIEKAPHHIQKIFSENIDRFQQFARSHDLKAIETDWSSLSKTFLINVSSIPAQPSAASVPSIIAESSENLTQRSSNPRRFGNAQSFEVMQRNLVIIHGMDEKEAARFTQQVSDVLGELGITFREFSAFRKALLLDPEIRCNLSRKAEISLALAILQEQRQANPSVSVDIQIRPRLAAIQFMQSTYPDMALRDQLPIAKEIGDRLSEVKFEVEAFGAFHKSLLRANKIPRNLSKAAEISAAIAIVQERAKGKPLDESVAVVNARLSSLPLIQQYVPLALTIDCIHEGYVLREPGYLNAKAQSLLREALVTMKEYSNTENVNELKRNPLLAKLEFQFGKDFSRNPAVLKRDGQIDPEITAATQAMQAAQINVSQKDGTTDQQLIDLENRWLKQFTEFFADDNVAKVASHYLNQTIFGSLSEVCMESGHTWVDVIELDDEKQNNPLRVTGSYTAELVIREGQEKCVIQAALAKFGSALLCMNFEEGGRYIMPEKLAKARRGDDFFPVVPPADFQTSTPTLLQRIEIELDVKEMKQLEFNPRILNTQIISNFQLDWKKLDKIIEENRRYERQNA